MQRIFNQLWSENGSVIPFYFDIAENQIWLPDLAINYYRAFASQYISFLERDESLVRFPLSLEEIRAYGTYSIKHLVRDVDLLLNDQQKGSKACKPSTLRFASPWETGLRVLLERGRNKRYDRLFIIR